jgi:tripartite-type tricarboxylate transporter receptor subunit TctC
MNPTRYSIALLLACAAAAHAQDYPSHPIRIETGGPGSNGDFASRLLGQVVSASVGQQIVVENRASGILLGETVAKAAPDGYTLLVTGSSFWLAPFLEKSVPWDPIRDFLPVSLMSTSPNLVVVHPSVPVKSIKELIALAKAHPGALNYASGSTGSAPHLSAELFNRMAGVSIVRVNYKGAGAAMNDLIAGQVQVMFPNAGSVAGFLKSGRLRALAVTTLQPSPLFPGLPTVQSAGLKGFQSEVLNGMFVPAKTPQPVITRLNQEFNRALVRPEIKDKFFSAGMEVIAGSADQLMAAVKNEINVWGKLIKDQGIRND